MHAIIQYIAVNVSYVHFVVMGNWRKDLPGPGNHNLHLSAIIAH